MTTDQLIVFGVLGLTLVLFMWNRWRHDIVAVFALLAITIVGLVPVDQAFLGLGHPAVITVAAVLVLSRGLLNAGVVDAIARHLTRVGNQPWIQVATLTGIVALSSSFMNNVGALALFMPVAISISRQSGRSPSLLLMPLAFASLLGGTITMIGTPPNIIIASYREVAGAAPFGLFDFLPVGLGITVCGLAFIALVGWRLTPRRDNGEDAEALFQIGEYLTEVRVVEGCKFAGRTLHDLLSAVKEEADVAVIALVRGGHREELPSMYKVLHDDDILQVEADSDSLKTLIETAGVQLVAQRDHAEETADAEKAEIGPLTIAETIVGLESRLVGTTAYALDLRERFGLNVLAVARRGHRLRGRLAKIRFAVGDILLVQAREESLPTALKELGCLPLASRGLSIGKPRNILLASGIFAGALGLVGFGLMPAALGLVAGALVMVLSGLVPPREIYKSIDMPVIVLLAALLPLGQAMETTGGSQWIADQLLDAGRATPPAVTIALLMGMVMVISNVINNAATAVLAAPVAINLAHGLGYSPDPFLMAVAIGASCAFLTPIGHQSNTLVMTPGGYAFGDYWRMGLPLSLLVVATGVPLILWFWGL